MAHSWSIAGGVVTLTLDGSESGEISRSRTFTGLTADAQYTVYLTVTPDDVNVGAFLAVTGGDTAVATAAGTLTARGDADGSGNLEVTFGVQDAGGASTPTGSDGLEYADRTAIEAAGYVVDDAPGGSQILYAQTDQVYQGTYSLKMDMAGGGTPSTAQIGISKTFDGGDGIAALTAYTVTVRGRMDVRSWYDVGRKLVVSGSTSDQDAIDDGGVGAWQLLTATATSTAGAELTVSLISQHPGLTQDRTIWWDDLHILGVEGTGDTDFSDLTYCSGTGVGDGGTGLGDGDEEDPPSDPIPDPPPDGYPPPASGGARPFGLYRLPVEGLGYWNSTVKGITPTNTVNLVNDATTAGSMPRFRFGPEKDWFDASGTFQYSRWKVTVDRVYNDARCKAALDTAIAAGVMWAFDLMDEPNRVDRYNGAVPLATVERMFQYVKSLWPTARTVLRTSPTNSWFTRHISGLDTCWSEYHLKRGDVTTFRDREIAGAAAKGHTLILGIHYVNFDGIHLGSSVGRVITPSELRHYGGILASSTSATVVGMDGWCYVDRLVAQPGFWDALKYVRDLFASLDP